MGEICDTSEGILSQIMNKSEDRYEASAINIRKLLAFIEGGRKKQPKLLRTTAGGSKFCIFKIPQTLKEINPQAYQPHIVSIGPYHHDHKGRLNMMEEHKWRFLDAFLARSEQENGAGLQGYLKAMAKLEGPARGCYSEEITSLDNEEFVKMLLLDGCFIVELLLRYDEDVEMVIKHDPIFNIPWVIPFLMRDLLRLENQLPFFVLQQLFDLSNVAEHMKLSLQVLAIKFFSWATERPVEVLEWSTVDECDHLLDLFRATFIPRHLKEPVDHNISAKHLHCVSKLLRAGMEFKPADGAKSFLEIRFKGGVLEIPKLRIDDFVSSFFQNCIAYEQSRRHIGTYFTAFATFMDCLIDTEEDVALLADEKIIENYFGTDDDVALFFNQLGREVIFDVESCYLAQQFDEVNEYYRNSFHVKWAEFKSTYFGSPWTFISALAAFFLLVLAVVQTVYTVYPYYRPS